LAIDDPAQGIRLMDKWLSVVCLSRFGWRQNPGVRFERPEAAGPIRGWMQDPSASVQGRV